MYVTINSTNNVFEIQEVPTSGHDVSTRVPCMPGLSTDLGSVIQNRPADGQLHPGTDTMQVRVKGVMMSIND